MRSYWRTVKLFRWKIVFHIRVESPKSRRDEMLAYHARAIRGGQFEAWLQGKRGFGPFGGPA